MKVQRILSLQSTDDCRRCSRIWIHDVVRTQPTHSVVRGSIVQEVSATDQQRPPADNDSTGFKLPTYFILIYPP